MPLLFASWVASPLADEVLFVTCEVQQVLYALGVVGALASRTPQGNSKGFWGWVLLAFGSKEEAIVLVPLVLAQDLVLFSLPWQQAWRRGAPLMLFSGLYLVTYKVFFGVQASWFYATPWLAPLNWATTWPAFWHFHGPVLGKYAAALATTWPWSILSLVATFLVLKATWRQHPFPAFGLLAATLCLLPTLPANLQVPRYTFLPYLFFLASLVQAGFVILAGWPKPWLPPLLLFTWLTVAGNDLTLALADRQDWGAFGQLTEALEGEMTPVLEALRAGKVTLVERGADGLPLARLYRQPRGIAKVYFPRPDDPYGVVSLSALASWRLRQEGLAAVRCHVPPCPSPQAAFRHELGGFFPLAEVPSQVQGLFGSGKVLLVPQPAAGFNPEAFP
jgi:hypothetical protein